MLVWTPFIKLLLKIAIENKILINDLEYIMKNVSKIIFNAFPAYLKKAI